MMKIIIKNNTIKLVFCYKIFMHLKLVDWPLLAQGTKPIYKTEPMHKFYVYIHVCRRVNSILMYVDKMKQKLHFCNVTYKIKKF